MASAATRRFLTARCLHLSMLNWEVDPALLAARVPAGTELDTWGARCLVSMVGFQLRDTRVLGVGVPFHRSFEDVNLRFYVRRSHPDGDRRGVVFVKELVPRRTITWIAHRSYHENYQALPMFHPDAVGASERPYVSYGWRLGGREHRLDVRVAEAPCVPDLESGESFTTEHYWGYVRQREGSTLEYRVEHPRWRSGAPSRRTSTATSRASTDCSSLGPSWVRCARPSSLRALLSWFGGVRASLRACPSA